MPKISNEPKIKKLIESAEVKVNYVAFSILEAHDLNEYLQKLWESAEVMVNYVAIFDSRSACLKKSITREKIDQFYKFFNILKLRI